MGAQGVVGLAYASRHPQMTLNMSAEQIQQATRSFLICGVVYAGLFVLCLWQDWLHWRLQVGRWVAGREAMLTRTRREGGIVL